MYVLIYLYIVRKRSTYIFDGLKIKAFPWFRYLRLFFCLFFFSASGVGVDMIVGYEVDEEPTRILNRANKLDLLQTQNKNQELNPGL